MARLGVAGRGRAGHGKGRGDHVVKAWSPFRHRGSLTTLDPDAHGDRHVARADCERLSGI